MFYFTLLLLPFLSEALSPYGHAFGVRPHDFTDDEYVAIAGNFSLFTVEKLHAAEVYGNASAPAPFKSNSYAATVGTGTRLKKLNPDMKILMYWNSFYHFNLYECEAEVKPEWVNKFIINSFIIYLFIYLLLCI